MGVEPQVQQLLDVMAANARDLATLTPAELRAQYALQGAAAQAPEVDSSDSTVPGPTGPIPVRLYEPAGSSAGGPTIVWYHGGGWVIGNLETHDGACRRVATASGMRVVSVERVVEDAAAVLRAAAR